MSKRSALVRALPCIACELFRVAHQPWPTTEHHLALGGHAGQKRRGDAFSIPLCRWHHQGYPLPHVASVVMASLYGPSYALQSRKFRERFGSDDELLTLTDKKLEKAA